MIKRNNTEKIHEEFKKKKLIYKMEQGRIWICAKKEWILNANLPRNLYYEYIDKDIFSFEIYEEITTPNLFEIIKHCYQLGEKFIFKELNSKDFIKISQDVVLLNLECLIPREDIEEIDFIVQRFDKAFSDEKYLFVDKRTGEIVPKEDFLNMVDFQEEE